MSLLTRPPRASYRDLLVGAAAVVVVAGLAYTAPSLVGILLAALAVGAVVLAIALSQPLLALILVVLASFGRTAQKEFLNPEVLTPMFYAMLLALGLALARRSLKAPRLGMVEWLMAAYLVWNLVSALLPHQIDAADPMSGESLEVYRWIFSGTILPFVIYVVAKAILADERSVRWMLWTVVGMTAYSVWVGLMQFHGPAALVWPRFIVDDPTWEGRAVGVFDQPVVNGVLLTIGFMVCLFLATRPDTDRRVRIGLYALSALTAYGVYLTYTRSALLTLVVVLVIGAVFARGWRRPFQVYLGLGAAAVAVNARSFFSGDRSEGGIGSSNEIYDRLNLIATSLRAIGEHPFVGVGIARFRPYNTDNHVAWSQDVDWNRGYGIISHQNELGIAAELGIPGALLWIAVLLAVLFLLWRAVRELPDDEFLGAPLALVGVTAMVVLIVTGLTVDLRILDFAGLLAFLFAGMVVGALERHRALRTPHRAGVPGGGLRGGVPLAEQIDRYARPGTDSDAARRDADRVPAGAR